MKPLDVMRAIRDAKVGAIEKAILYGLVLRADNATGESWPSYHTIAADAGISVTAAKRKVKELEAAGLIEVRRQKRGATAWAEVNRYVVRAGHEVVSDRHQVVSHSHHVVADGHDGGGPQPPRWSPTATTGGVPQPPDLPSLTAQSSAEGTAKGTGVAPSALPSVLEVQESTKGKKKRGKVKLQVKIADPRVGEVFDAWKAAKLRHNPRAKPLLTEDRREVIQARLDEGHDVQTLKDACTGIFLCSHNTGDNEQRTEYLDLELALRDAKHIERFAELAAKAREAQEARQRPEPSAARGPTQAEVEAAAAEAGMSRVNGKWTYAPHPEIDAAVKAILAEKKSELEPRDLSKALAELEEK